MSQPKFTKQHYEFIAEIFRDHYNYYSDPLPKLGVEITIRTLANKFKKDNPRFNTEKFIDKCIS